MSFALANHQSCCDGGRQRECAVDVFNKSMLRKKTFVLLLLVLGCSASIYISLIPTRYEESKGTELKGYNKALTKVHRFNGRFLTVIQDFCHFRSKYKIIQMKTINGPVPTFFNDIDLLINARIEQNSVWFTSMASRLVKLLTKYPEAGLIDVGAHVGLFSLYAAKLGRKVVSIEPMVANVKRLCKSTQLNNFQDQIQIVLNPASNSHKMVKMKWSPDNLSVSSVILDNGETGWKFTNRSVRGWQDTDPKQTIILDDILPVVPFKMAIMKIDVELHEYEVMNGAHKLLDNVDIPAILMEWGNVRRTPNAQKLVELMKSKKYRAYQSEQFGKPPLDFEKFKQWPHDVVWVQRGSPLK